MKSRKAKIILSIFIALGMVTVTTDCAFQRMRENLKNCEFDLDSVSIKSLSFTSIELALDVGIKNPNAEQVILDKLVFDLYGSDRKLGSGPFDRFNSPQKRRRLDVEKVQFQQNMARQLSRIALIQTLVSFESYKT